MIRRRVRSLYVWSGGSLHRIGNISEARLRAWEYGVTGDEPREITTENEHDTVRRWTTTRPDLKIPEDLWVGDREEATEG